MKARLNPYKAEGALMAKVSQLEAEIVASGLDTSLVHLIKTRASQVNGCAYCIDLHTMEAMREGETAQRLFLLNAWRDSPLYSDRERAALEWTEAVTQVSVTHVPDAAYEVVRAQFSESDLVKLTLVVAQINVWNRIGISFRSVHPVRAVPVAA